MPKQFAFRTLMTVTSLVFLLGFMQPVGAEGLSEDLFKGIVKGCLRGMETKVVMPHVSKAYCYCYAETLSTMMGESDFDRIAQYGVSDQDKAYFSRARKSCKPGKAPKVKSSVLYQPEPGAEAEGLEESY